MHRPRRTVYYTDRRPVSLQELEVLQRFSSGDYAFSVVGILKIVAALAFLVAGVVFLCAPACAGAPVWYATLPPALHLAVGLALIAMYSLFTLGFAEVNLAAWVKADMGLMLLEAAMAVTGSVLTLVSCSHRDTLHFVPSIMGLLGTFLLVVDCAGVFVMWNYHEEEGVGEGPGAPGGPTACGIPGDRPPPRKSIFPRKSVFA